MSEETTVPEVTAPVAEAPAAEPAPEVVPKSEFDRVLADMHKYKGQLREISSASQAEKEKLLREQNNWQELAQLQESKAREAEEKLQQLQSALVNREKYSALKDAAMKAGIRSEALSDLELVGLDKVQVETTSTGRVNVIGVGQTIESLKLSRPHWFGGAKTNVSGSIPSVDGSQALVTSQELVKLSVEARKSGDYATYEKKLKAFQQQQRKA